MDAQPTRCSAVALAGAPKARFFQLQRMWWAQRTSAGPRGAELHRSRNFLAQCCNCRQQLMHARIYSTVYVYNQFFDPVLMELQGRIAAAEIVFSAWGLFSSIPGGPKLLTTGADNILE